VASTLIRTV